MTDTKQCESLRCTMCWFDLLTLFSCCLLPLPPTPCLDSSPRTWKTMATSLFSLMFFPLSYCSLARQPSVYILRLSSRDIPLEIFWTHPPPPYPLGLPVATFVFHGHLQCFKVLGVLICLFLNFKDLENKFYKYIPSPWQSLTQVT